MYCSWFDWKGADCSEDRWFLSNACVTWKFKHEALEEYIYISVVVVEFYRLNPDVNVAIAKLPWELKLPGRDLQS